MQHPPCHVSDGERGEIVSVEGHIAREGLGLGDKQPMLVLGVNLEAFRVPKYQVVATVLVVIDLVDTALRPRIVSISVGAVDATHIRGRANHHRIGERAVAHLDKHPEAIDVRHDQVVAIVVVHITGDVYVADFALARRIEVRGNRH